MECIFCKNAKGEVDSYTIYEDEMAKAFLEPNPEVNGHVVIIPKKHFRSLDDIDEKTITHIMMVAKRVKKIIEEKLEVDGITLFQTNDKNEECKHFHLDIKPCYSKRGRKAKVENIYEKITKDES